MKTPIRLAVGLALVCALVSLLAGSASGHGVNGTSLSCAQVTGTFQDFTAGDHPIVWNVQIGDGAPQTVATVETPPDFVGTGTATAAISALTDQLNGAPATVHAFATWPGGQSATLSAQLTCGSLPVVTTTLAPPQVAATVPPPQVGGIEVTAPSVASAAAAVPAAPSFTG
jgi:hypothetical protein